MSSLGVNTGLTLGNLCGKPESGGKAEKLDQPKPKSQKEENASPKKVPSAANLSAAVRSADSNSSSNSASKTSQISNNEPSALLSLGAQYSDSDDDERKNSDTSDSDEDSDGVELSEFLALGRLVRFAHGLKG
ncbi:Oidioi.mRNA.OKI2018_I69.XSR.g16974.t3.cds [Oikopleura dioica]|uniref:Oidioi.mRNA.OKI2018_I69.XSR.g16974.t3.cds n=1 Tax=Oikopleura dioica TaxID=34765 RepID=A0ABN7SHU7_OIKDI|nr:Oidioi.mRNA.OKI2018_I69.XSR.g16974.t3.cds [Oikopleura dioica]